MKKQLRYSLISLMMLMCGSAFGQELNTCAEVIAGEDGTVFRVSGKCSKIINKEYGNWNLLDETGEILIYGTRDKDGNTGKNYSIEAWGIEVGDIVLVEGAKKTYNEKVELVDVTVIDIKKVKTNTDNPLSNFNFITGNFTDTGDQLVFDFEGLITGMTVEGSFKFDFENDLCKFTTLTLTFASEALAQLAYQYIQMNPAEIGASSVELDGKTLTATSEEEFVGVSRIVIKSMLKMLLDEEESGYGTAESPLTPNVANVYAGSLESGATTEEDIFIKGKIASIKDPFNAEYGNASFYISADGNDDFTFYVYRALYLENQKWVEGNTALEIGDEVIICGKLTNYKGTTPETAQGKAFIYSLNGKTKAEGGEVPQPSEAKAVSIADFNAAEESTEVWYQLTGIIKNLKDDDLYGNFDLEDETGSVYVYGLLSEKGGEKKKFQELVAEKGIKNGDKLTLIGNRGSYKDKIEVLNAYFVSVESGSIPEPEPEEAIEVSISEALSIINALEDGKTTEQEYIVQGTVAAIDEISTQYGNATFDLIPATEEPTGLVIKVYRAKGFDNEKITDENFIQVGYKVTVQGKLQKYVKNDVVTPEISSCYIKSIDETSGIQTIRGNKADGAIYNLAGQRVEKVTKGIFIQNGKKFVVK